MKIRRGFSLFEVTVYIAIIAVVMVAVLGIVAETVLNRTKAEALHNVTASTRYAIERMSQEVRAATDISGTTITLADGTVRQYYVTDRQLYVATNGGSGIALTPSNISVTEFNFTDRTTNVSITLSVENNTTNPRPEYQAEFSLTTTVSTRL